METEFTPPIDPALARWHDGQTDDVKERFGERAGIMEYEGGLSRMAAEVEAFKEIGIAESTK